MSGRRRQQRRMVERNTSPHSDRPFFNRWRVTAIWSSCIAHGIAVSWPAARAKQATRAYDKMARTRTISSQKRARPIRPRKDRVAWLRPWALIVFGVDQIARQQPQRHSAAARTPAAAPTSSTRARPSRPAPCRFVTGQPRRRSGAQVPISASSRDTTDSVPGRHALERLPIWALARAGATRQQVGLPPGIFDQTLSSSSSSLSAAAKQGI